jgi:hypothetical protein
MSSSRLPFFISGQDFGERSYAMPDYVSFCHVYNLSIRTQHAAWLVNGLLISYCIMQKEKFGLLLLLIFSCAACAIALNTPKSGQLNLQLGVYYGLVIVILLLL